MDQQSSCWLDQSKSPREGKKLPKNQSKSKSSQPDYKEEQSSCWLDGVDITSNKGKGEQPKQEQMSWSAQQKIVAQEADPPSDESSNWIDNQKEKTPPKAKGKVQRQEPKQTKQTEEDDQSCWLDGSKDQTLKKKAPKQQRDKDDSSVWCQKERDISNTQQRKGPNEKNFKQKPPQQARGDVRESERRGDVRDSNQRDNKRNYYQQKGGKREYNKREENYPPKGPKPQYRQKREDDNRKEYKQQNSYHRSEHQEANKSLKVETQQKTEASEMNTNKRQERRHWQKQPRQKPPQKSKRYGAIWQNITYDPNKWVKWVGTPHVLFSQTLLINTTSLSFGNQVPSSECPAFTLIVNNQSQSEEKQIVWKILKDLNKNVNSPDKPIVVRTPLADGIKDCFEHIDDQTTEKKELVIPIGNQTTAQQAKTLIKQVVKYLKSYQTTTQSVYFKLEDKPLFAEVYSFFISTIDELRKNSGSTEG